MDEAEYLARQLQIDLETKVAYQEDTVQSLNDVVTRQQKQIDQLEKTCEILVEQLREISGALSPGSNTDEKPPHY